MSLASGYFELQLLSVDNPKGQLLNGDCCDAERGASDGGCGADECDTYVRVCLKEYQKEVTTGGPCIYGSDTTKVIGGNTFQFKGSQKTGQNRISDAGKVVIPFQFAWPVSGSQTEPVGRTPCVRFSGSVMESAGWPRRGRGLWEALMKGQVTYYLV